MKTIFLLVLAMSLSAFAQSGQLTGTINLLDASPSGAPITFTGSVRYTEWPEGSDLRYTYKGSADGVNVSQKPIVAWAATTTLLCCHAGPVGVNTVSDHYFRDHAMPEDMLNVNVGGDEKVTIGEDGITKSPDSLMANPLTRSFTTELTFVQFDDGSTWGKPEVLAQLQADRAAVQGLFQSLSTTTDPNTLLAILRAPQPTERTSQVAGQLIQLQKTSGNAALIAKVQNALGSAAARKATGKF